MIPLQDWLKRERERERARTRVSVFQSSHLAIGTDESVKALADARSLRIDVRTLTLAFTSIVAG